MQSGLEGVVAFATEIAEPDKEGGALRYRGVDIEELVGQVPFENVWGLLVDGEFEPGLPPAEPHPLSVRSGDPRVDVQSALAQLAPERGFEPLIDISDEQARDQLARASVMALSFVPPSPPAAPGGRGVPQREVDKADSIAERFLIRSRREADPAHAKAIERLLDLGRRARHERVDVHGARDRLDGCRRRRGAVRRRVGALSGPLHGGAPARVLKMLDEVEREGDAQRGSSDALDLRRAADGLRPPRLPRRGSRAPRLRRRRGRSARAASRSPRRSRPRRWPS